MGYEGRTASSTVPDEAIPRLRAAGGRVKPGSKPVAATVQQLPTRPRSAKVEEAAAPAGDGQVQAEAVPAEAPAVEVPEPAVDTTTGPSMQPGSVREAIRVPRGVTPQDLAERLGTSAAHMVK